MSNYISKLKSPYQDIFGTTPVDQIFEDQVGNFDVTYKNVQVGKFDGIGSNLDSGVTEESDTQFTLILDYKKTKIYSAMSIGYFVDTSDRIALVDYTNGETYIVINGTYASTPSKTINTDSIIAFSFNGNNAPNERMKLYIDGLLIDAIATNQPTTILSSTATYKIGVYELDIYGEGLVKFAGKWNRELTQNEIQNYSNYTNSAIFAYNFQSGDDSLEIDISGNGNDGIFTGGILVDFRGTKIDGIDSVNINNGYSRFQQIADPTKFIYAAYTDAGVPTHTSIVGYESPIEIPKNVISDNKITYSGILNAGISETDASFDDIDGIEIIPKDIFQVAEEDGVFTDWAVQPYESEPLKDNTGEILYDVNGEKLYPLKEF